MNTNSRFSEISCALVLTTKTASGLEGLTHSYHVLNIYIWMRVENCMKDAVNRKIKLPEFKLWEKS